jgi:predicted PolB exonuclease-like 3'-5' exonuclease
MIQPHLALDVETVPIIEISEYSKAVQQKIQERIKRRQERDPDFNYEYFASIHGDFGKIICISLGYIGEDQDIRLKSLSGDNESKLLLEFNQIIEKHSGIYIHYNGLSFDIPFIIQRMTYHSIKPAGRSFKNLRRYSSDPHFDVMMQYYNWDLSRALPLGILAELHGMPSPKEELAGDKVFEAYKQGEWDRIVRYCEFDTATTLNLWRKLFLNQSIIPIEKYIFTR